MAQMLFAKRKIRKIEQSIAIAQLWFQHIDCSHSSQALSQIIWSINFKAKWNKTPFAHILAHIFPFANRLQRERNAGTFYAKQREGFKSINHNRNNKRINRNGMGWAELSWAEKERFLTKREYYFNFIEFDREKCSLAQFSVWFKNLVRRWVNSMPSLCFILHICTWVMHRFHKYVKMLAQNYAILDFPPFFQSILWHAMPCNEFVTFMERIRFLVNTVHIARTLI